MDLRKITALIFIICSGIAQAAGGTGTPATQNTAGYRRMGADLRNPAGGRGGYGGYSGSGLIKSPNPIDTSSNLVVTGNVRGNSFFRGSVPYGSPTSFRDTLGSTSLDQFVRRSASVDDSDRYSMTPQPYYSDTGSVTMFRPGYRSIFTPSSSRLYYYSRDLDTPLDLKTRRILSSSTTSDTVPQGGNYGQAYQAKEQMDNLFSKDSKEFIRYQSLVDDRYKRQLERFKLDIKDAQDRTKYPIGEREKLEQLEPDRQKPSDANSQSVIEVKAMQRTPTVEKYRTEDGRFSAKSMEMQQNKLDVGNVYVKMQQDIDELKKVIEQQKQAKEAQEIASGLKKPVEKADANGKKDTNSISEMIANINLMAEKAKRGNSEYKSFATLANDQFNVYMRVGEEYMKAGRYYMADSAYRVAGVYKPDNPLVSAGRCHALFAAGEYMSSALQLARTLEVFPQYAAVKVDLVSMIGDKDKVESRIADIEKILEFDTSADELRFLLAYIYQQMGRTNNAIAAIKAASDKIPDSKAMIALKAAIEASQPASK